MSASLLHIRPHSQREQITATSSPKNTVSKSDTGRNTMQSILVRRQTSPASNFGHQNIKKKVSFGPDVRISSGDVFVCDQSCASGSTSDETSSEGITSSVATSRRLIRRFHPDHVSDDRRSALVVSEGESVYRPLFLTSGSRLRLNNGRLHGRLGRPSARFTDSRKVVPSTTTATHQQTGAPHRLSVTTGVPPEDCGILSAGPYGQHDQHVVHQQAGRNKVSHTFARCPGVVGVGHAPQDIITSGARQGPPQHPGRLTEQIACRLS